MDVSDSIFNNLMMFVSTEESAQGQGPQEPDPVQHADAPEERQAKGEVRFCLSAAFRKYPVLADSLSSISSFGLHMREEGSQRDIRSARVDSWSCCKDFSLTSHISSFQGSYASAEEVPKAVWCPSEVGPEIPGRER